MQSNVKLTTNQIPCGFFATTLTREITAINQTLCDWLGVKADDVIGQNINHLLPMASRMMYLSNMLPSLQQHHRIEENYLLFKVAEGHNLPFMINAKRIEHDTQPYFSFGLMLMNRRHLIEGELLYERRKAQEATQALEVLNQELVKVQTALLEKQNQLVSLNADLESLSITDTLTNLFNRRFYDRELNKQMALFSHTQKPFCLVLLDIDKFKLINDNFGHDVGDLVLIQFAKILRANLRTIDTLARIGGEEFAIILPNTDLATAVEVANQYRILIATSEFACGKITTSGGVVQIQPNEHKTELFARTDKALYQAKQNGRNQIVAG